MGILDQIGGAGMDPRTAGILAAAFQGLQASGPSRMPVSLGQVIGQGGEAGMGAYAAAAKSERAGALSDVQIEEAKLKLKKMQQDYDFQQKLIEGGILDQTNPDKLEALGTKLVMGGHPGAAGLLSLAEKQRAKAEDKASLGTMRSTPGMPGILGAGVSTDSPQGKSLLQQASSGDPSFDAAMLTSTNAALNSNPNATPQPLQAPTPGNKGIFGPLIDSPHIGPYAKQMQDRLDSGGFTKPAQVDSEFNKLLTLHQSADAREAALDARPTQRDPLRAVIGTDGKPTLVLESKAAGMVPATSHTVVNVNANRGAGAGQASSLPTDALDMAASRYLTDGTLPPNMGRGAQGTANTTAILTRAAAMAKEKGMDGEATRISQLATRSINTALTGLERQRALVMAYEKTALAGADIAMEMSNKVDRATNVPIVDKWINAGRKNILGDPDVTRLNNAVETFTNEYAKVMSGSSGGQATTVSMQQHAREMLSGSFTKDQFAKTIDLMKREMIETRETAFDKQITEMKTRMVPPSQTSPGAQSGGNAPSTRRKYNPATGKIE